jgi:hypothetical protein
MRLRTAHRCTTTHFGAYEANKAHDRNVAQPPSGNKIDFKGAFVCVRKGAERKVCFLRDAEIELIKEGAGESVKKSMEK